MPPLQQYYQDLLAQRVRGERHPSHQLLNRMEATLWTPDQVVEKIVKLHAATGIEQLVIKCSWPGLAHEDCMRSIKLLTDESLWLCHVDPAQLQTAVLNLALNGRNAMLDGGVLEIETRNVIVPEGDVAGCSPGSYVRLSVKDAAAGCRPKCGSGRSSRSSPPRRSARAPDWG